MLLILKNKSALLAFSSLFVALTIVPNVQAANVQAKTNHNHKHKQSKFYLVPPPPPYVPSMLPELSRYHGSEQSYSSYWTSPSGTSPATHKPNKYLTYYSPNKG